MVEASPQLLVFFLAHRNSFFNGARVGRYGSHYGEYHVEPTLNDHAWADEMYFAAPHKEEKGFVFIDSHILCTPAIGDIDGDGRDELVVGASYFFDRDYYDTPVRRPIAGSEAIYNWRSSRGLRRPSPVLSALADCRSTERRWEKTLIRPSTSPAASSCSTYERGRSSGRSTSTCRPTTRSSEPTYIRLPLSPTSTATASWRSSSGPPW